MYPKPRKARNQQGFGLVAAIFVIVILATVGLLIARYTLMSQVSSAEDYLWAQALYSANSAAQLRILEHDNGGNWPGAWPGYPSIQQFAVSDSANLQGVGLPSTLRVTAQRANITRIIEVKYIR